LYQASGTLLGDKFPYSPRRTARSREKDYKERCRFVWLLKSKSLRKISLDTNIESTVDNTNLQKMAVGDTGIAISRLNPHRKSDGQ